MKNLQWEKIFHDCIAFLLLLFCKFFFQMKGEQEDFEVAFAIHLQHRNSSANTINFTVHCVSGISTILT